jgi:hypothetical protein
MHIKNTPLEINFIYLGNKEICCILRHAASSLFDFPQNVMYFLFIFLCSNNMFFHKSDCLNVKPFTFWLYQPNVCRVFERAGSISALSVSSLK